MNKNHYHLRKQRLTELPRSNMIKDTAITSKGTTHTNDGLRGRHHRTHRWRRSTVAIGLFVTGSMAVLLSMRLSRAAVSIQLLSPSLTRSSPRDWKHEQLRTSTTTDPSEFPRKGAFLHLGKTAGSTLSLLLRNGCHSFMPHPCRNVSEPELPISYLTSDYYHLPDFGLLPTREHDFYVLTVRDPWDRTISAFAWDHVRNRLARNDTIVGPREKYQMAYQCFPTLERFTRYLEGNSSQFHYPYHKREVHAESCIDFARAAIHGRVKIFGHFFFGYVRLRELFLDSYAASDKPLYVVRQEAIWEDWTSVHQHLLPRLPPSRRELSYTLRHSDPRLQHRKSFQQLPQHSQPVTKEVSIRGKAALCRALQGEYEAYGWFLHRAENLKDLSLSRNRAEYNCGEFINISASFTAGTM